MRNHEKYDDIRALEVTEMDTVSGAGANSFTVSFLGMKFNIDGYNGVITMKDSQGCVTTHSPTQGTVTFCGDTKKPA